MEVGDATANNYRTYLSSLTQAQMKTQASTLSAELQSVNSSLTALALRESQSFSVSTIGVLNPLPDITETLTALQQKIPDLDHAASFHTSKIQEIAQSRKGAALLSRTRDRLQEILDLPKMIEKCVDAGHYMEATDLSLHLQRIQARHPQSALLKSLVTESEGHMQKMALQLLALLATPLKLAMALKVIGFLRRTGSFEEVELRFLFLKGRYDALNDVWSTLEPLKDQADRYIKKYVEVFREQVFAIITQYNSIFQADDSKDPLSTNLLSHFAQRVIVQLTTMIDENIDRVESQSIKNTLLTQLLYTSQSMARVGCDFIGLIITRFGDDWQDIVVSQRRMSRRLDP